MQKPSPVPELLQELRHFATAVSDTLASPEINWQWRPAPAEWNLTELCCHLRDVEREVHQLRFKAIIANENAFISGATPDDWVVARDYKQENGRSALNTFLQYRQETITLLANLDDAMWQRQGRHSFFGPTSMHELLNLVVGHDEAHWQQIQNLVDNQQ
ncbi:MAG: DinB family protein [Anaerolineae bacterium]|nr:DinB family protein [Anaerolineae bacterium]